MKEIGNPGNIVEPQGYGKVKKGDQIPGMKIEERYDKIRVFYKYI